jgi:hypothetical protein
MFQLISTMSVWQASFPQAMSPHPDNFPPLGPAESPHVMATSFIDVEPTSLAWNDLSFSVTNKIKDETGAKVCVYRAISVATIDIT